MGKQLGARSVAASSRKQPSGTGQAARMCIILAVWQSESIFPGTMGPFTLPEMRAFLAGWGFPSPERRNTSLSIRNEAPTLRHAHTRKRCETDVLGG